MKIKFKFAPLVWLLILPFTFCLLPDLNLAQTQAPGAPGRDAQWATAGKQGVGTSNTLESKIWFTLAQGVLTEVYYPDVTVANVHLLQFVVVNPTTKTVETEQRDAVHQVKVLRPDSLTFQQINTAKSGEWKITKTYATDPERDSVLIDVRFEPKNKDLNLYLYYDPSLGNSGMGDNAGLGLGFSESFEKGGKSSYFHVQNPAIKLGEAPISEWTTGFYGVSDGLEQLQEHGKIVNQYSNARNGNVAMTAKIEKPARFTLILGFGESLLAAKTAASATRDKGFLPTLAQYEKGWADYVKTLRKVEPKYQAQFNMAAMQLRAHEDKTHRGANIASLSVPWGGGDNANKNEVAGYHLVWSRDLYQVATAFMALGDKAAAVRALDFLFKVQQKPDGSFPQNSFLDGKPFWRSLQMDEVAYPLILAYQLGRDDAKTWTNHVKKAADFLIKNGPRTPQERWEEEAGYSASTIAAEIAGLVCAAEIARKNGDEASATIYTAAADDWVRHIERWTATTTGKYGDGNYYVRITNNGKPDAGEKIELNNGAGFFDEREIVDAGFLELVRLGIKPANDPLIAKSVKVIDEILRVKTPNGESFYRYNNDGYGEMDDGRRWNWDGKYTGKGRLWALLAGERGQYEIANCELRISDLKAKNQCLQQARGRLDAMLAFANEGMMIPEQIWDKAETPENVDKQFVPTLKFGEGTGSATPLAWSMAQFIRLAVNLQAGKNLEMPDVVYNRYVKNGIPQQASAGGSGDMDYTLPEMKTGEIFRVTRRAPANSKVGYLLGDERRFLTVGAENEFALQVAMPENDTLAILTIITPDGASAFERVRLRLAKNIKAQEFSAATIEKIKNAKTSPLIENGKALFVYRGSAKQVRLAGDFTGWSQNGLFLQDIGDGVKAAAMDFPATARVEYQFIADGKWITDPLNLNNIDNGVGGRNSFFAMPDYKANQLADGEAPKLEEFEITSKNFGARKIKVYLPPDYATSTNAFPVLYVQDGSEYFARAGAANVQLNLVNQNKIKPFIIVFIDPKDRMKEYWANNDWADFVANELVLEIDKRYRTVQNREGRALIGASLGGITSVWIGLKHPDKFARIGAQSSSFWVDNERVIKALSQIEPQKTPFRFYLDDGVMEGVEDSQRVVVMLRGKGYPVVYHETHAGHNWTAWRDRLADAFLALWQN